MQDAVKEVLSENFIVLNNDTGKTKKFKSTICFYLNKLENRKLNPTYAEGRK